MDCNEIWVIAETRMGQITRSTLQLLGAARLLADQKDLGVVTILMGEDQIHSKELAQKSPIVLHFQSSDLKHYEATRYIHVLWQVIESRGFPVAILSGATATGLEFMPRLAMRCGSSYASYCTDIWWHGWNMAVRRPVFGGKVYEEIALLKKPVILTVRPVAFSIPNDLAIPGKIDTVNIQLPENIGPIMVERKVTASGEKDVSEAARVVAGGRGMGSFENFKLLEELAQILDGAVGASRSVVDSGWRSHGEQVGKSGKTISPELYIACGISGAIHHVLGMNTSKVIVAINKDPDAAIFKNADYGMVGDVCQVIPELVAVLKSHSKNKIEP